MKNKKILMFLLSLNVLIGNYVSAASTMKNNYDKPHGNTVKNIDAGKTNVGNYKLIEQVLNKRNKELKDLYAQSDYVEKPGYLEWQVFFSAFYDHKRGGNNTLASGDYHSNPDYDKGGVKGESLQEVQTSKNVDLGVRIPLKQIDKPVLDLNVIPTTPIGYSGTIKIPTFNLPRVNTTLPTVNIPTVSSLTYRPTGNGDSSWIAKGDTTLNDNSDGTKTYVGNTNSYNGTQLGDVAPIAQINLNGGIMNVAVSNTGLFDLSLNDSTASGVWGPSHTVDTSPRVQNFSWTGLDQVAVMKLVGGHDVYVDNLEINFSGTGVSASTPKMLFHIDAHNDYGSSVFHVRSGVNTNITGSNLMYFGIQYHTGNLDAGLIHDGTITTSTTGSNNVIFGTLEDAAGSKARNLYFTNNGTITLNGNNETLGLIDIVSNAGFGGIFTNSGTVNINGTNSYGVIVSSRATVGLPKIILNTPLNINGSNNIGVGILREVDTSQSLIKLNVNGADSFGIAGDYTKTTISTFKNYELATGAGSNNNILVILKNGDLTFDSTGKTTTMAGTNNFGFVGGLGTTLSVDNNITSTGDKNLPLVSDSSTVQYAGNITTDGVESHGLVVKGTGILTNISGKTVSSVVSGNGSVALYNEGTVNINDSGVFKSLGNGGTAVFSKGTTNIMGANNYEVGTNGIGFYANGGRITLDGNGGTSTIKIGAGSIFSHIDGTSTPPTAINFNNGIFNVSLDTGATGFIYKGVGTGTVTAASLQTYMNQNYGGLTNVNVDLGTGSRLFVLEEYGSADMSSISTLTTAGIVGTVTGTGKDAFLWKGSLVVDTPGTIDLDNPNENFNKVERSSVGVTLNSGVILTGTQTSQVGLADKFMYTPIGTDYRAMLNNGTISLTGTTAVGIYTDYGTITNNSIVSSTGNDGIGLFGENGSVVVNDAGAVINLGTLGIGMYGISYQNPASPQAYGTGTVNLTNNGTINANAGLSSVGMYGTALLGKAGSIINDTSGIINIGQSSQGMYFKDEGAPLNIFTNNGQLLSNSTDTVGMYLDNPTSTIITNTGIINLTGDRSRGIYITNNGATNVTNSGNITVGGSTVINDPSIGIYSENSTDTITNTGNITAGLNSLGIYSKTAIVNHIGGTIAVGDNGTGIYSDQGNVTIGSGATISLGTNNAVAAYGINSSSIVNSSNINIGNDNYGFIIQSGSILVNNGTGTLGDNSVFAYSNNGASITNNAGGVINMIGSDNIAFYMNGGSIVNNEAINGTAGLSNIGIASIGGTVTNNAAINVGDSVVKRDSQGNIEAASSIFAIGIYGDGSSITNNGTITMGKDSVGLYAKDAPTTVINTGNVISNSTGAIGLFVENSTMNNTGNITLSGAGSIGIAAVNNGHVINTGTITMDGENSKGVYLRVNSTLDNNGGTIIINGANSIGVDMDPGSKLLNSGTIIVNSIGSAPQLISGQNYPIPSVVNSGVIIVNENFNTSGLDVIVEIDPSTIRPSVMGTTDAGAAFISDSVKFYAPYFTVDADNPVKIAPGFTKGTNSLVYKLEDMFNPTTPAGGPNSGIIPVVSKSLTWSATPNVNAQGNIDIWMQKIPYDNFTNGLWYADFGRALDDKYGTATGEGLTIFNKMDYIENETDFRRITASLAGNVYANINQRENDIAKAFESSLNLLQDSMNNTKENVKINVITGMGSTKEDTDGIVGYDYTTVGVLALREVERTYRKTFGYSLGYLHTGFEFEDGNQSEEWVDTIQLGVHNKYGVNGWNLKNDLTGRASIHNVDRNIDWPSPYGRSELNGNYETYSITSDNKLGKEIELAKSTSITPYGAFRVMYVTRPSFEENGLERVQVEGNDAWSVKPKVGLELNTSLPLGPKKEWQLKGTLDFAYEYELADLNEREKARLVSIEDGYNDLAKPEDENGRFSTKLIFGAEVQDRYGVFLNGEYSIGDHSQEDYRAGVLLKTVF